MLTLKTTFLNKSTSIFWNLRSKTKVTPNFEQWTPNTEPLNWVAGLKYASWNTPSGSVSRTILWNRSGSGRSKWNRSKRGLQKNILWWLLSYTVTQWLSLRFWNKSSYHNTINYTILFTCKYRQNHLHWEWSLPRAASMFLGLSGLRTSELIPPSILLGLAELAMENTPESAWLAGESLLLVSRGDSTKNQAYEGQRRAWIYMVIFSGHIVKVIR